MHLHVLLNNFCPMLVRLYLSHAMDIARDAIVLRGDAGGDYLDFQGPLLPAQLSLDERDSLGVRDHIVGATNDPEDATVLSSESSCHDLGLHGLSLLLYILRQS